MFGIAGVERFAVLELSIASLELGGLAEERTVVRHPVGDALDHFVDRDGGGSECGTHSGRVAEQCVVTFDAAESHRLSESLAEFLRELTNAERLGAGDV